MTENKLENNTSSSLAQTDKSLTKDDLLQVAKLVRIKLDDSEIDYYLKELKVVLSWIQTISQVNTQNIAPMSHGGINDTLPLREDIINDGNIKDIVLFNSTEQEHDFFVVPKVIE
ncbi:Asp-tRNA(Asn)/Glu-tRNA(Gln) amidotransferase subunit GatC [Ehrlichia canis]|uniref:Aspartyl/glutamyl-tRNA(Asn/Gln) amidotransferase subunit C n=1 Tax=Ehrlichia canis (strain Jake) TaxID=269484 RepID=A0ACA6AWG1_EHRCJ|nr:Asp-tRNA(Asn)/Glu-tRNA(Gln) amidotransferase subunit GatC [Ehrlichia canis]AAZ68858.1 aspartyl/glutamyl-tRNA(Asn/Gln) amidotransferase subunit C [Ehrlichia canis str. Jake]AUO55067.1 Asp-tRNA(Asn)/Glu-tRNA(Gln) amidotransferase subunit GatC [Ehrlichia canis]UKC53785.1 gatC [Ehrlichia canis]UKC54722.1 gatC [Ehrlichia canis]UKC55658.1 gatC [Ehrlichia canis]